jgi:sulfotransferase
MTTNFHFMAGLPRSGSTLLSAILSQNPRIYSGPASPVLASMMLLDDHLRSNELFISYPGAPQATKMVGSLLKNFYTEVETPTIIDNNRAWPARISLVESCLGKEVKILCPVRDLSEVLTSMISLIHRSPPQEGKQARLNFLDDNLIRNNIPITDENRCSLLVGPSGVVGQSAVAMMEALGKGYRNRLHFIEYRDLVSNPKNTLEKIYDFLGEDAFGHDFNQIENKHRVNDLEVYGLKDMHEVRSSVKATSKDPSSVLPPEVLKRCKGSEFWREPVWNLNTQSG